MGGRAKPTHFSSENPITQFQLQCLAAHLLLQFWKADSELASLFSAVCGGCSPYLLEFPFSFNKTRNKCPSMSKSSFHILDHKNFLRDQRRADGQEPLEILLLAFVLNFPVRKERAGKKAVCRYSGDSVQSWWQSSLVMTRARSAPSTAHLEQKRKITLLHLQIFYKNEVLFIFVGKFLSVEKD